MLHAHEFNDSSDVNRNAEVHEAFCETETKEDILAEAVEWQCIKEHVLFHILHNTNSSVETSGKFSDKATVVSVVVLAFQVTDSKHDVSNVQQFVYA